MDADTFQRLLPYEFHKKFLARNIRPDGRALNEARPIKVDKGGITSADGSSTVRLGKSIAVCGIKCQVAMPDVSRPNQGWLVPNVELGPLCSSKFRPGPPNEMTQLISHIVNESLKDVIDLSELCIEEGSAVWVLHVDVLFISFAGNALDLAFMAIRHALEDLQIPRARYEDGMVMASTERKSIKLRKQIQSSSWSLLCGTIILDPTDQEEDLSEGSIRIIMDNDAIVGIYKTGVAISTQQLSNLIDLSRKRFT